MYDLRLVSLHSIAQQEIFRAMMETGPEKSMKHEKNNILKTTAKLKMYMSWCTGWQKKEKKKVII